MAAVWELFPGGGSELLALLALSDFADDDGRCFPSVATIAKKTRLSKSQAQRVVHGLIASGVVQVEGNESGGAPGSTRRYRVMVDRLTGGTDATRTGSASETGRTHAADGSHGRGETGRTHATQTTIEPSVTTNGAVRATASPPRPVRPKREEVTLTTYLETCKAANAKPIPDGHSLRTWAAEAGITAEMLQIAWVQFRERYTEGEKYKGKRYRDWPAHFATAIKANWFKLWFSGDGGMQWTSNGLTHKTVLDARIAAQNGANHA